MPASQLVMQDIVCTECNGVITEDNVIEGLGVCQECLETMTGYCDSCGEHYMSDSGDMSRAREFGVNSYSYMRFDLGTICASCVHNCPGCGSEFEYESDMWDCCPEDEDEEQSQELLHYYSFRPSLKFWSVRNGLLAWSRTPRAGELYMGLEIEVEKAADHVRIMVESDGTEDWYSPEFYYWKSDGSLSGQGAEMVTMPATLEAHTDRFPFEELEWLHDRGARAWAYQSCGMHIHVSRTAFGPAHMWKFIKFQLNNSDTFARIAGRNSVRWAAWDNTTMSDASRKTKDYVKNDIRNIYYERYSALNFNNVDTVELRYFRSNIAKHGILRNVQLVHAVWAYTKQMTIRDYIQHRWSFASFVDWMNTQPGVYGTLIEYIKKERIA